MLRLLFLALDIFNSLLKFSSSQPTRLSRRIGKRPHSQEVRKSPGGPPFAGRITRIGWSDVCCRHAILLRHCGKCHTNPAVHCTLCNCLLVPRPNITFAKKCGAWPVRRG